MWILPKQLIISHSAQVMRESDKESEEFCQLCEKSLMWRSKPSQLRTWLTRWKRKDFVHALFTRTLKPSHTKSFVEKWTSCHSDSHANLSAQLVRSEVWKMKDIYSPTLPKELESCNLELFSQKMYSESSVAKPQTENLFSNMSEGHWKKWVTQLKSEYSQRVKSACPTKEKESSSVAFPTPRSSDAEGGRVETIVTEEGFKSLRKKSNQMFGAKLRDAIETMHENQTQWKTPTATQVQRTKEGMEKRLKERAKTNRGYNEGCLEEQVVMREQWATPQARDGLSSETKAKWEARAKKWAEKGINLHLPLNTQAQIEEEKKNWSTPRANATDSTRPNRKGGIPLAQQAKESWATPTARDYKDSPNDKTGRDYTLGKQVNGWSPNLQADPTNNKINGRPQESLQKGYLNPRWVEQLMDLPIDWTQCHLLPIEQTDLDSSETE